METTTTLQTERRDFPQIGSCAPQRRREEAIDRTTDEEYSDMLAQALQATS